ncbi:MAG TPA: hypothetical protein DIT25_00520, partial [Candidatus Moranbacteria bacterium]|nr:hypothetical protein [Candidatus Moranbacteria bacterium]
MLKKIPVQVIEVLEELEKSGFEAYVVGGCVRDLIMDRIPKDWDVATNSKPDEVQRIFSSFAGATEDKPATFYENDFGTVGLKVPKFMPNGPEREYDVIEITTYRIESKYSDKRRPDAVRFAKTLEEDLSRRDFTMNAVALKIAQPQSSAFRYEHQKTFGVQLTKQSKTPNVPSDNSSKSSFSGLEIIDPYDGQKDIKNKIIRTVGNADERFDEDALRMMRAIRFHAELGFEIEKNTFEAIQKNSKHMAHIAMERIKDELVKIILSENASEGIDMLHKTGILEYVIPELEKGVGVKQNRHHIYTIYQHSILALKYCPSKKLEVRLASLLHDIAKPQTKRGEGEFSTFYNHDHVGARVAEKILDRLRFSKEIIQKVKLLVDQHMFYYNPEEVGDASVRRLIKKVGLENMKDLIDVRIADRLG